MVRWHSWSSTARSVQTKAKATSVHLTQVFSTLRALFYTNGLLRIKRFCTEKTNFFVPGLCEEIKRNLNTLAFFLSTPLANFGVDLAKKQCNIF